MVRALFQSTEIIAYADSDSFDRDFTIENIGVNSLSVMLKSTSGAVTIEPSSIELSSNALARLRVSVSLKNVSMISEYLEITSNESHPTLKSIPVVITQPSKLAVRVEPAAWYAGEFGDANLVISHVGGGPCVIQSAYSPEEWPELEMSVFVELGRGEHVSIPIRYDATRLQEGDTKFTVILNLKGLGDREVWASVRLARRPNVIGTPVVLPRVMPNRVRVQRTEIRNESDNVVTMTGVRTVGGDWLRLAEKLRFPLRLEVGGRRSILVEIRTHGKADQHLEGKLEFDWNSPEPLIVKIDVRVLRPDDYGGYVGIDFGTTNSCVALSEQTSASGDAEMVPMKVINQRDIFTVIPTAIYYPNPKDLSEVIVGEEAREKALEPGESAHTILRVKRDLGAAEPLTIHNQRRSAEQVTADILRFLIDRSEDHVGAFIKQAVVTVPAGYSNRQMKAMLEACRLAGLEEVHMGGDLAADLEHGNLDILDEPLAAAIDYVYSDQGQTLGNDNFMIFDFGGGTLDVAVLKVSRIGLNFDLQVLAVEGREIGGEDLTDRIAAELLRRIRTANGLSERDLPFEMNVEEWELITPLQQATIRFNRQSLTRKAEEMKVRLSASMEVRSQVVLRVGQSERALDVEITRDEFEALVEDLIDQAMEPLVESLESAGLPPSEISKVILTGGTSHTPAVRRRIEERFQLFAEQALQPKECVSRGASRMAWHRHGVSQGKIRATGIHNLTSCRFGIMVTRPGVGNQFIEVIPKGVQVPTRWYTYPDPGQRDHADLTVSNPNFSIPVMRKRSLHRISRARNDLQGIGTLKARIPGTGGGREIPLRLEMHLDRNKVLSVRVHAADELVDGEFKDM